MTEDGVPIRIKKVDEDWKRRVAEEKKAASPPVQPSRGTAGTSPAKSGAAGPAPQDGASAASPGEGARSDPRFLQFLQGIAAQALMALGQIEGLPAPDLRQAKVVIDSLAMLQEKTRGNLSREEEQALKGLLQELQSIYVQMAM